MLLVITIPFFRGSPRGLKSTWIENIQRSECGWFACCKYSRAGPRSTKQLWGSVTSLPASWLSSHSLPVPAVKNPAYFLRNFLQRDVPLEVAEKMLLTLFSDLIDTSYWMDLRRKWLQQRKWRLGLWVEQPQKIISFSNWWWCTNFELEQNTDHMYSL